MEARTARGVLREGGVLRVLTTLFVGSTAALVAAVAVL